MTKQICIIYIKFLSQNWCILVDNEYLEFQNEQISIIINFYSNFLYFYNKYKHLLV